jgi:hypothetical protein
MAQITPKIMFSMEIMIEFDRTTLWNLPQSLIVPPMRTNDEGKGDVRGHELFP